MNLVADCEYCMDAQSTPNDTTVATYGMRVLMQNDMTNHVGRVGHPCAVNFGDAEGTR